MIRESIHGVHGVHLLMYLFLKKDQLNTSKLKKKVTVTSFQFWRYNQKMAKDTKILKEWKNYLAEY